VLYFVLDFLFVLRLCAFIILFPYYSSIQLISCKCVFIKLLCSVYMLYRYSMAVSLMLRYKVIRRDK